MTQKQQIDLLNSIMPEITESASPEPVLLKCAKEHNLAPAQLEKLAQVYNTTKTLVGLEKQANRGDSFSIINVPDLVSSYTTYDPEEVISGSSKGVHTKVDKLMKVASNPWANYSWEDECVKSASADTIQDGGSLPSLASFVTIRTKVAPMTTQEKVASFFTAIEELPADRRLEAEEKHIEYRTFVKESSEHTRTLEQIMREMRAAVCEKCAAVQEKLTPDNTGKWQEVANDIHNTFGGRAERVIQEMENYFDDSRFDYDSADMSKFASASLVQDKYDVLDTIENIADIIDMHDTAQEEVIKLASLVRGMKDPLWKETLTLEAPLTGAGGYIKMVPKSMRSEEQKAKDKADDAFAVDLAKQELMMGDPIIAEADPKMVNDIYDSLAKLSPVLAKDPLLMSTALKESIQYGAVPLHIIDSITKVDNALTKSELARIDINADKYK